MNKITLTVCLFFLVLISNGQWMCELGTLLDSTTFNMQKNGASHFSISGSFMAPGDLNPGEGIWMTPDLVEYGGMALYLDSNMEVLTAFIYPNTLSRPRRLVKDDNDNFYIIGEIENQIDLDLGDGEYILTADDPEGDGASFIAKYSSDLELVWGFRIGNSHGSIVLDAALMLNGNLLITGILADPYDLDPGVEESIIDTEDSFFAEYSPDGDLVDHMAYQSPQGSIRIVKIKEIDNGHMIGMGYIIGEVDVDPGENEWMLGNVANSFFKDAVVLELDAESNFLRAFLITGFYDQTVIFADVDEIGNLFIAGYMTGFSDFDPGQANTYTEALGAKNGFLAKYDSEWNFEWVRRVNTMSPWGWSAFEGIALASDSLLLTAGYSDGGFYLDDIDSEQSVFTDDPYYQEAFLAGYDPSDGELLWVHKIGSVNGSDILEMIGAYGDNFYVSGFSSHAVDLNPWMGTPYLLEVTGNGLFVAKYHWEELQVCPDTIQYSMESNNTIQFLIEGVDMGTDVHWDFGDGAQWDGSNVALHEYEPGTYVVHATFNDPDCPEGLTTYTLEVEIAGCTISLSTIQNEDGTTSLVASGDGFSGNFSWDIGDGVVLEDDSLLNYQFVPGQYYPCVTSVSLQCPNGQMECIELLICDESESILSINLESVISQNGPGSVDWEISDMNNELLFNSSSYFTGSEQFDTLKVCLSTGCYNVGYTITDNNYDIDEFYFEFSMNGEVLFLEDIIEFGSNLEGILAIEDSCGIDYWCDSNFNFTIDNENPGAISFDSENTYLLNTFVWTLNGDTISNLASDIFQITDSGDYTLCLTITNEYCNATACQNLEIDFPDNVEESDLDVAEIFPNPANQKVVFIWKGYNGVLQISDVFGKLIYQENFRGQRLELDTSGWPPGGYMVRFSSSDIVNCRRLIIVR